MGNLWWSKLPREAGRFSPGLFGALSDGAYLTGWPPLAALAPVLALVIGVALGNARPESWAVPTESIVLMAILVIVGGLGAALGAWLAIGYAIGDFVLRSHPTPAGHAAYSLYALAHVRAPLLIAYAVLAGLAVLVPLGSRQLSEPRTLGIQPGAANAATIRMIAHAILAGLLTAAWLITAPSLLRPVFTWQDVQPPTAMIPSGSMVGIVALLAAGAAIARDRLESVADARPGYARFLAEGRHSQPAAKSAGGRVLPVEASLVVGAVVGTFLLSGLLHSTEDALLLGSVLLLFGVLRSVVSRDRSWTVLMARVPFAARLAASVLIGGILARAVFGMVVERSPAFLPMACALGASLCVTALLLPAPPSRAGMTGPTAQVPKNA